MKRVAIIKSQEGDWVGMYIDRVLICQGHELGDGNLLYLIRMSEKYKFSSSDITIKELCNEDQGVLEGSGRFPDNLGDFVCSYDHN